MKLYSIVLILLTLVALYRAWIVDSYLRSNGLLKSFFNFINNISIDDFYIFFFIVPFFSKTKEMEKQRKRINLATYVIYGLLVLFFVSIYMKY